MLDEYRKRRDQLHAWLTADPRLRCQKPAGAFYMFVDIGDVLVVPHHGSRTSSTAAFLDAVQPRVAVIQAGYRNRFGHPAPDVVERYRERGIATAATPDCGAWLWPARASPEGVCQRDAARRYWHHRSPAR